MMKKSLIALALVAAAPVAFAATSNVDVYGAIDASVTNVDVKINGVTLADNTVVGSLPGALDGSKIGLKGSEDLGGGMKAVWQVESTIDVDGGASRTFGTRNTYVGLSGGFGTVLAGRHDTPEKMSTGALDLFADQNGDYNQSLTIVDTRENNVIAYVSPDFSGMHFAVAAVAGEGDGVTTGETAAAANASNNNGLMDHWSAAAIYKNGPLHASAAMTSIKAGYVVDLRDVMAQADTALGAATTTDIDIYRIGLGYTIGDLKMTAIYQNIDVDGVNILEKGYVVGAAYTMGPIVLKAQYNERENLLKGWTVGADYNLSKRTAVKVAYTNQKEESGVVDFSAKLLSVGLRHSF
jgi:predicted porin